MKRSIICIENICLSVASIDHNNVTSLKHENVCLRNIFCFTSYHRLVKNKISIFISPFLFKNEYRQSSISVVIGSSRYRAYIENDVNRGPVDIELNVKESNIKIL
jgi:hypothetical protein